MSIAAMSEVLGADVERVFGRIAATRMAGLPLNNPALRVEAIGFRAWEDLQIGVLITPWAINLMLLPGASRQLRPLALDQKQAWSFPSGTYEFMGGVDDELGSYHFCSLFSPAFEFSDQDEARAVALATLSALFAPEEAIAVVPAAPDEEDSTDPEPLSRRNFLRGGFRGKAR